MKQTLIDELTQRISRLLPDNAQLIRADIENNIHALLQETINKLNLVSREEFEIQAALLQRSREKLDALEKKLAEINKPEINKAKTNKSETIGPE